MIKMDFKRLYHESSEKLEAQNRKIHDLEQALEIVKKSRETLREELTLSKEGRLKDANEDQDFIVWAKAQKIQSFKRGELEVHFHHTAFIGNEPEAEIPDIETDPTTDLREVDDDILFHSSN